MAEHKFTKDAGAALIFAILYGILFVWMLAGYITGRYKWRSRWSLLFFHVTVRVASQALGVAFGILVFDNIDIFVAYLIMGAEGYFTLTIAAYLFLKSWQKHNWGDSWLASDKHCDGSSESGPRRILSAFLLKPLFMPWRYKHHVLAPVHSLLIPANAIIMTGGSFLAGDAGEDPTDFDSRAKIMRSVGSGIFLAVTLFYNACVVKTFITARRESKSRTHPTLPILAIVGVLLIVRGLFGLLQSAVWSLSYVNPSNYTSHGFTSRFIALEYCLTVLPEFTSAALMNLTYWTARKDRYVHSSDIPKDIEEIGCEPMVPNGEYKSKSGGSQV
ncbi:hypothetical protein P389DRAFT_90184 [Cystobasidium minutum MCA 4210]|uniref:uncharacterized protein n=1 Tax=Cystobasidium minutum MCA 4210 TaxID=1397322 RepID=UPI0034CF1E21|eukprot:jgi/Rhomi1/90184/CE90183_414